MEDYKTELAEQVPTIRELENGEKKPMEERNMRQSARHISGEADSGQGEKVTKIFGPPLISTKTELTGVTSIGN
jgi:hypothetical protein